VRSADVAPLLRASCFPFRQFLTTTPPAAGRPPAEQHAGANPETADPEFDHFVIAITAAEPMVRHSSSRQMARATVLS